MNMAPTGNEPERRSHLAIIVVGLVMIAGIAAIDYYTPPVMDFAVFYLLPIMLVTWRAGWRAGVYISGLSAISWLGIDMVQAPPGMETYTYWNATSGFFVFLAVVYLLSTVRGLKEGLEDKVNQRMRELQASFGELQLTEARLRASEERFRQLAEGINDVFWMTDVEHAKGVYISPAYEAVWGRPCASWYDAPGSRLEAVHPDDRERVRQFADGKMPRTGYDEEYRIVRPDGAVRWVHDRAFPIRDKDGKVYRLAGIVEDITQRKAPGQKSP